MRVDTDDGVAVVAHDLGGDGPAILLCHATGFCGRAYTPLAERLGERFHVWALDFRGHGDSARPPHDDFAWEGLAHDVVAVARAIGPPPIHVLGHSMGGAVALQAAGDHPGLFATAFLYEPIVLAPGALAHRTANPLADGARVRREIFDSPESALWRFASRPPLRELGAGSLAAYVEHGFEELADGTVRLKCRAEDEARTFEASGTITWTTVASARVPVVVATGGERDSPLAALAPGIVAALPLARHVVYGHLGHFGPLQDIHTIAKDVIAHATA